MVPRKALGVAYLLALIRSSGAGMWISPYIIPPTNGQMGYLVAIAVPLDLERFNVFWSLNYEANWNNIGTSGTGIKDLHGLPFIFQLNNKEVGVQSRKLQEPPHLSDLVTRKHLYESMSRRLDGVLMGSLGRSCLLRAICEHAVTPFGKHNGFVGDILHIVLSPSASKEEPGMEEYLEAETVGRQEGHCGAYSKKCGLNVLDMVSTLMHFGEK